VNDLANEQVFVNFLLALCCLRGLQDPL